MFEKATPPSTMTRLLIAALLSLSVFYSTAQDLDEMRGWKDFRWGMTVDSVRGAFGSDWDLTPTTEHMGNQFIRVLPKDTSKIEEALSFEGMNFDQLSFVFHGDSLYQVGLLMAVPDHCQLPSIVTSALTRLRQRFGACDRSHVRDHIECEWFGKRASLSLESDRPKYAYPFRIIFRAVSVE